jgi:hypothetical protein
MAKSAEKKLEKAIEQMDQLIEKIQDKQGEIKDLFEEFVMDNDSEDESYEDDTDESEDLEDDMDYSDDEEEDDESEEDDEEEEDEEEVKPKKSRKKN